MTDKHPPENLWLQWHGDGSPDELGEIDIDSVTFAPEQIYDNDVRYVRLDIKETKQ